MAIPRTEIKRVKELNIDFNTQLMLHYIFRRVRPIESFISKYYCTQSEMFHINLLKEYECLGNIKKLRFNSCALNNSEL